MADFLDVACALIRRADGRILAARRGPGQSMPGKWEFPGGKIEPGESSGQALVREIREELSVSVELIEALPPVEHGYPGWRIRLHPWWCLLSGPEPVAAEHDELRWLRTDELAALDWAEADLPIVARCVAMEE